MPGPCGGGDSAGEALGVKPSPKSLTSPEEDVWFGSVWLSDSSALLSPLDLRAGIF